MPKNTGLYPPLATVSRHFPPASVGGVLAGEQCPQCKRWFDEDEPREFHYVDAGVLAYHPGCSVFADHGDCDDL